MKKATKFLMGLFGLFLTLSSLTYAQNGIIGSGFGTDNFDWSTTDCFNDGVSGTRILTATPGGTGNQYFRLVTCWSENYNQWGPSSTINDLEVTIGTALGSSEVVENSTSKAYYINVPNASYNYVFKTRGGGNPPSTPDFVVFEVQGDVRSVSSASNDISNTYALDGDDVVVTATLDGSFSTGQSVYLRYTDDNYSSSTIVEMSGSGTTYTATIPGSTNQSGTSISYYLFTSGEGLTISGSDADFFTINLNNNSGSNYSYNVVTAELSVTGSEGWRILSSPTSDNSYDDLLGGLWTQGIATGADATNGTANVQAYDGSSFSAVSDLTATMSAGVGFITYVYSDDDYDGNAEGFPKTLSLAGTENSGDVKPTISSGNLEWSLVGNPFASTIDADGFTFTDMFSTVYVYDHSYGTPGVGDSEASGSAGSYRVWNGAAGSLTNGLIAPFQGFWVQNTTTILAAAELTIPETSKTSGGTFYKAVKTPVVELKVEQDGRYSTAYFSFTADGELAKDSRDALKLLPLDHKDYVSISSLVDGVEMDINNLPAQLDEEVEVALNIKSFDAVESGWAEKAGEFMISWPQFENIPENWKVTLTDHETGQTIDLRTEESYSFQVTEVSENIIEKSAFSMLSPVSVTKQKGAYNDRFVITIKPNFSTVDIEENSSPEEFTLSQNYPNPFNPSTNIRYSVAEAGDVTLSVFNLMGQKVAELVNENKAAGTYSVSWNASGMASGMYYYRLASAGQTLTRKMTLIK